MEVRTTEYHEKISSSDGARARGTARRGKRTRPSTNATTCRLPPRGNGEITGRIHANWEIDASAVIVGDNENASRLQRANDVTCLWYDLS